MQNELPNDDVVENGHATVLAGAAAADEVPPPCQEQPPEIVRPGDEQTHAASDNGDDSLPGKKPPTDAGVKQDENRVYQLIKDSPAKIMSSLSGDHNIWASIDYHPTYADAPKSLDLSITIKQLQFTKRSYKSIDSSHIAAYTGTLLTHRILLLSCHNDDVALNVAKSVAYEIKDARKQLVTIETNCQGSYTLKDLIEQLARSKENSGRMEKRASDPSPTTICVWEANDISEGDVGDISNTILDSLFIGSARVEQYQAQLGDYGLCLICLISPQKLEDYKRSRSKVKLQNWDIDFLLPLLEEHELNQFEQLAETIVRQRQQGLWSAEDAEFYKEVGKYLRASKLPEIVANKAQRKHHDDLDVQQLFNRQDPLTDTVLYCATYYPNLSPQDFSHLVELFLGDSTEEVIKKTDQTQPHNGKETVNAVEAVPIARRWQRESDAILRRCKLAAVTDENNKRVVDFQEDGLRIRLSQYIRSDHYFFYESQFFQARQLGLLFSPKKKIAEGARQLLVEMGTQYPPNEVAHWLYEIVAEFEQMAQAADLLRANSQLFHLLPDAGVKAARRYVGHGLSLVLSRLHKEPELQEAARLFWQRLLQTQHQWFLDLLRQMGNAAPAESLNWLKQLLDQGSKEIRRRVHGYLVGYLLRQDSLIYPTLNDLMQWRTDTQAGRSMQMVFIVYCIETNRQLAQQDYGQWPSLHPLFGFQNRAEAREGIELLIGWLFAAAFEVDELDALSVVADIVAGWYFILSPASRLESADAPTAHAGEVDLDARTVRQLLLERLMQHCSRAQKNDLLAIWESFKSDILEEVFRFEEFANQLAEYSLNAKLMRDAATVRRKLLDTRVLLGQLRKDFIHSAPNVTQG